MIKLMYCLHRLDGMTRDEFQRYWREVHGPLVRKHADVLRVRRYVQVHTITTPLDEALRASRGGPEGYDGVAELWFDSLDDFTEGVATPEGIAAALELAQDEKRFIAVERSPLWLAEEHDLLG